MLSGPTSHLNGTVTYDVFEEFDIGGTVFSTRGNPPVRRGRLRNVLGKEVATVDFEIMCGGGSSAQTAAMAGDWDGADLTVTRTYVGGGSVVRFEGFVSDVQVTPFSVRVTGKSLIPELRRQVQSREFSSLCPYVLGSTECGGGSSCDHSYDTCTTGNFGGFAVIPTE